MRNCAVTPSECRNHRKKEELIFCEQMKSRFIGHKSRLANFLQLKIPFSFKAVVPGYIAYIFLTRAHKIA
jgi:hypothetical protein